MVAVRSAGCAESAPLGQPVNDLTEDERREWVRLEKKLLRKLGAMIRDYGLINVRHRITVAISGGKDSRAAVLTRALSLLPSILSCSQSISIKFSLDTTVNPCGSGWSARLCAPHCTARHLLGGHR